MIKDLSEDIAVFAQELHDKDPRAASHTLDMCAHGESRIAFEDLLSNLHESGAVLSEAELARAEALTLALGQSVMQVEALRGLLVDAQGRRHAVVFTGAHFMNAMDLHRGLAAAFDFPSFYGNNWDAFWDAITGLVQMPHVVKVWGWDKLSEKLPHDAAMMLGALLRAERQFPTFSAEVQLFIRNDEPRDPTAALACLRSVGTP